jgi:hypothetical protein
LRDSQKAEKNEGGNDSESLHSKLPQQTRMARKSEQNLG